MGFSYHKHKGGQDHDATWTSMSDLFLGMSIIFLCLYMTAVLHQGSDGRFKHIENQRLTKEVEDLKGQLKVYNTLKQNYMAQSATQDEQESYQELMGKLDLLKEEAKEESERLQQAAGENDKKAQALNKYQQMIRNMINSNMISKARVKSRDSLLDTKDDIITEKSAEITSLEKTVNEKKNQIAQREEKISDLEDNLDDKLSKLQIAYKQQKISKKKFEEQQAALERDAENKIAQLKMQNDKTAQELSRAAQELSETEQSLQATQGQLQATTQDLQKVGQEKAKVEQELAGAEAKAAAEAQRMRNEFAAQAAKDRDAFQDQLNKEKLSGAERAAREKGFRADAERKAKDLESDIASLQGKQKELEGQTKALKGDLAKAMENLNAKKNLANKIKKTFGDNGVKAEVDPNTGDVLLSFGDQYFDSGQAKLKPGMRQVLEQAMPLYATSLFENPKISEKIQSVEIVGFASPTYKGKFVDPASLSSSDRAAIDYNLDLSYGRAKAIFSHVFDKNKMEFKHQQRLLPLVKVTGRSFLASDKDRGVASSTSDDFCRKNDCAKQQRVIIKFTLKD